MARRNLERPRVGANVAIGLGFRCRSRQVSSERAGRHLRQRVREVVASARAAAVPVIFIQEVHTRTPIDMGRELDGVEGIHCLRVTRPPSSPRPGAAARRVLIRKRRYSAFFATELELVLKSYGARTLVLVGALTNVCVHDTFADAHEHDHHCRVVTDCVGGSSQYRYDAALEAMAYLQSDCLVESTGILAATTTRRRGAAAAMTRELAADKLRW